MPSAEELLAPPEAVVSLDMRIAGGALWNCRLKQGVVPEAGKPIPGDAVECGSHPTRDLPDLHRTPFVSLQAFPHEKPDIDYDGFFWLSGTLSLAAVIFLPCIAGAKPRPDDS